MRTERVPSAYRARTERVPSAYRARTERVPSAYRARTERVPSAYRARTERVPSAYRARSVCVSCAYRVRTGPCLSLVGGGGAAAVNAFLDAVRSALCRHADLDPVSRSCLSELLEWCGRNGTQHSPTQAYYAHRLADCTPVGFFSTNSVY